MEWPSIVLFPLANTGIANLIAQPFLICTSPFSSVWSLVLRTSLLLSMNAYQTQFKQAYG